MGTELDGCIKERQEFFNVMANQQVDLAREDPFNALKEGITNWGSTMAQWSNEIQTSIHSYFRYNNSELKSLRELDYLRQYSLKQYTASKKSLAKDKTALWQSKDITTWQCEEMTTQEQQTLLTDLKLALPHILPARTLALASKKNIVDWVGYCELSEVLIFLVKEDKNLYRNFLGFSENVKELLGAGRGNLWDMMGKSYRAFSGGSVWVLGDDIDDNVDMGKIRSGIGQMSSKVMMMSSFMPKG